MTRTPASDRNVGGHSHDVMGALLGTFGLVFVALGIWGAIDPGSFGKTVANFGEYNPHLIHDYAVCSITFGTGLLLGFKIQTWRAPTLVLAAVWNGLHGFFHIIDIDKANLRFLGPSEAVLLCAASVALAGLAVWEHRRRPVHQQDNSAPHTGDDSAR